ncbi:MAG: RNase P modulator RnpM [Anaeroplasmataceae bacterium]
MNQVHDKKQVLRTCVMSREVLEKKQLFRIVRTPEKEVIIDLKGKANGRGAYLKKDKDIILKAQKIKILNKKLEVEVPDSIFEELLGLLNE